MNFSNIFQNSIAFLKGMEVSMTFTGMKKTISKQLFRDILCLTSFYAMRFASS